MWKQLRAGLCCQTVWGWGLCSTPGGSKLGTGPSSKYITLWHLQQLLNSAMVASINNIQMNGCAIFQQLCIWKPKFKFHTAFICHETLFFIFPPLFKYVVFSLAPWYKNRKWARFGPWVVVSQPLLKSPPGFWFQDKAVAKSP